MPQSIPSLLVRASAVADQGFQFSADSISPANRYNPAIARHIYLLHGGLNAEDTHRKW
jgi:hypothetical protein